MSDFNSILKDLKAGQYAPIYFLHGTEPYFIDQIANFVETNILSEAERSFNQTVLYGKETEAKTLIDTAFRYPMMAPRQVEILKEAQEMRTLKDILPYIEKPVETTLLVICYKHKKFNLNSKFGKALKAKAVVFESKSPYDNQMPDWIHQFLKSKKLKIQPNAAALVAEYLGTDLSKVANELEKLTINLPPGTDVNSQHIETHIGISKDYNIFELQRALAQRDVVKVQRIVQYFTANPKKNPLVLTIGTLYNFFSKVFMLHFLGSQSENSILKTLKLRSAYFLREYKLAARNYPRSKTEAVLSLLREYDLKSKGVDFVGTSNSDGELLKELTWRILHV